jgi:hypothetical protein
MTMLIVMILRKSQKELIEIIDSIDHRTFVSVHHSLPLKAVMLTDEEIKISFYFLLLLAFSLPIDADIVTINITDIMIREVAVDM